MTGKAPTWSQHPSGHNITQGTSSNVTATELNSSFFSTDCVILRFADFVPWNNPDNFVSFEIEDLVRALKDLLFTPVMFLIGCPTNIINMAVFYKQGLKERINVCLFALSLSDGLYLTNNMLWNTEQFFLRFTTNEIYGPISIFLTNTNLVGFHGLIWVSQVISAIIASERCFCILYPLRSQRVLRTSTMTAIIVVISCIILGLVFFEVSRYRIQCAYDPLTRNNVMTTIPGEFYYRHKLLIDYLDVFVLGLGLPGLVIIVVVTTTILTAVKLHQAATWRSETSNARGLSQRDIALTKMLVTNSVFFIICVIPFIAFRLAFLFIPEANAGRRYHNFYMSIQWILVIVSYFNSTFNFVIYYTMGSRYRQTFWQLLGRVKKGSNKQ